MGLEESVKRGCGSVNRVKEKAKGLDEHQTKWHWQVHCAPPKECLSVANRLALFLGMVV